MGGMGETETLTTPTSEVPMSGPVAESSIEVWDKQLAINLTTAYLATRAFLPMLRVGRGSIVLFASEAALPGLTGANRSAYAVRANAVAPASIRTAANVAAMGNDVRYVEREQVASAVTLLCSAAASAISGELLPLK